MAAGCRNDRFQVVGRSGAPLLYAVGYSDQSGGLSVQNNLYYVRHETRYTYSQPVRLSHQMLRLTPRTLPWQTCSAHSINIAPEPQNLRMSLDSFGNPL